MILLHLLAKYGPQRRPKKGQKQPKTDQENLGQILPNPYVYVASRPLIGVRGFLAREYLSAPLRVVWKGTRFCRRVLLLSFFFFFFSHPDVCP